MSVATPKPKKRLGRPKAVRFTIPRTPEGVREAEERLAALKEELRREAADGLRQLLRKRGDANVEFSDEEIAADVEEAIREVRAERRQGEVQ